MCLTVLPLIWRNDKQQGMKLGGPSKSKNILETLIKEDDLVYIPSAKKPSAGGAEAAVPAAVVAASVHPVSLSVEERLSCQVCLDGIFSVRVMLFLSSELFVCVSGVEGNTFVFLCCVFCCRSCRCFCVQRKREDARA